MVLLRQGKSYTFDDPSVRREWTIFPFLFRLKTPADEQWIHTDWEHEAWGWHDPGAIIRDAAGSLIGVPRLAESLRRVWFETDLGPVAGSALGEGLGLLAHDHESGARQLAGAALQTLRRVVAALEAPDDGPTDEWWVKVRFAAWHLCKNGRESMGAAITSALLAALAGIERTLKTQPPSSWQEAVLQELDAKIAARQESAKSVSREFAAYLEKTFPSKLSSHESISILTLSESSTIRQGLRYAAITSGFVLDLRILESRPLCEGVSLAGGLAGDLGSGSFPSTHKITLYSDASAAQASAGIDMVVLGADRIAASGAVSNKTGSLPAVLSATHVSPAAKIIVLGESDKIAPPGQPEDHVVEDNDSSQITRAWEAEYNTKRVRDATTTLLRNPPSSSAVRIETRNVFFEWVPARLVDVYVTESGEWNVEKIRQHSERLEAEERRVFGSL